ncbi:peptide chain release factor N(5)-glutamine methyltransferase [Cyclobacterium plantarum]|uniref:Release factor glutamine methyltransferase n=1 Tax=Cyclobacterium plantarum TaxID=2716263 RepID=A0ABX0H7T6_9BACT|nr:peptide chain release factor N(5)-glutamine methyltransferase [Cyclobacterium plantarum]NHE56963.1 peptide chain release factor N(5)-glutamine methyltransferase [Cyclobacterium plantarum]
MGIPLRDVYKQYCTALSGSYPVEEARNLVYWLFEAFLECERKDLLLDRELPFIPREMEAALDKLKAGMPIQYVLGKAPFYGRTFLMSPAVLVPRNETEELVHLILANHSGKLKVLDLGTGSGCIAITLDLEWSESQVQALDISPDAIEMARRNAAAMDASVSFFHADMLETELPLEMVDIMVSNPPYVLELEKGGMHQNVLAHEPHSALFVPDHDPLKFYRAIVRHARQYLNPGGYLYVEINEAYGKEVSDLMSGTGMEEVRVYQDLMGKDRVVWGRKPSCLNAGSHPK